MEEDDDDVHYCLVCNKTVPGLSNYILHKKNECAGRKNKPKPTTSQDHNLENEKFVNRSCTFSSANQPENLNQSYAPESYPPFSNEEFLASTGVERLDLTLRGNLPGNDDEYKKILSNTTSSLIGVSPGFNSTHINLVTDGNIVSSDNQSLTCNLSPIFSVSQTALSPKLSAVTQEDYGILSVTPTLSAADAKFTSEIPTTEDFGILSVGVTGNRNNLPQTSSSPFKTNRKVHLDSVEQLDKETCDQVEDFFQSLELMSKTDPRADKGQLPISNFLNNLTFSDDEDLGFDFCDDMSLDDSEEEDYRAPPRGHTGGKWKPGEKPLAYKKIRNRGKWPPGQGPFRSASQQKRAPASRGKNITLIPGHKPKFTKKSRTVNKSDGKIYTCSFCDITFTNRFQYSNHCNSKSHREQAAGQKAKVKIEIVNKNFNQNQEKNIDEEVDVREGEIELTAAKQTTSAENHVAEDRRKENFDEEMDGYETDDYFNEETLETNNKESLDTNNKDVKPFIDTVDKVGNEGDSTAGYIEVPIQVHVCTVCDKKFHNKFLLARHLLTKFHQNRALGNKEAHMEIVLKYHKYIVKLSPYQCGICQFYFNTNDDFENHLRDEEHEENWGDLLGEIQCTLCQFKTHCVNDMRQHIVSDEHSKRVQNQDKICIIKECHTGCVCKFCGLKMVSFARLQAHVLLKHSDGKIVEGVQKKKHGVRNRPICPACGIQMASASALIMHVRRRHSKEKQYRCEYCSYECSEKYSMTNHLKTPLHMKRKLEFEQLKIRTVNDKTNDMDEDSMLKNSESTVLEDNTDNQTKNNEGNTKSSQAELDNGTADTGFMENELDENDPKDSEWIPKSAEKKKRAGRKRKNFDGFDGTETSIKCTHCSFTVKHYDDLRPHYLKEHSAHTRICELCDMFFLSEKGLKLHILSREHQANIESSEGHKPKAEKYFQCQVCKKKFTDENYCKFHTAYQHLHSTTEEAAYKANGYKSVTRDKFADFLKSIEHRGFKESLACPECGVKVKKSNLMVHLRCHTDERPFLCRLCPKTFKSNYTLRKHLLGHYGVLENECNICGKTFNKPCNYHAHMELHAMEKSSKEKDQICDTCGQSFYLASQLKVHMRRHMKRTLKCTHPGCHWTFAFKHELNSHMITHTDNKPFLCTTCGFSAYSRYQLKRHERSHSNERKFHCEYCTYKAGNKTHLHRHMRIHIGSKPFKCPYCSFACNTHENIRKHILETKKHEGMKVYPCKFCSYGTNVGKEFRAHLFTEHDKETDGGARGSALSVFTGLFNREEDLEKPEEGMQILPCKERKHTRRKIKEELKEAKEEDWNEDDLQLSMTGEEKKRRRRKRAKKSLQIIDESSEGYHGSLEQGIKTDVTPHPGPYPASLIIVTHPSVLTNPVDMPRHNSIMSLFTDPSINNRMMDVCRMTESLASGTRSHVDYKLGLVQGTIEPGFQDYKFTPPSLPNATGIQDNQQFF